MGGCHDPPQQALGQGEAPQAPHLGTQRPRLTALSITLTISAARGHPRREIARFSRPLAARRDVGPFLEDPAEARLLTRDALERALAAPQRAFSMRDLADPPGSDRER